jgi:hypothetical protein
MKRILYGTTALVAAGMMIGEAYAAEGVKLGLGGRYYGAAGAVFGEDFGNNAKTQEDNLRSHAFKQDIEIYFSGETTLDIGLTVGARVELEGQSGAGSSSAHPADGTNAQYDQIDAAYAWISGGFGEIRFGDTGDAVGQMCYTAPSAASMFGADSPVFNFSNAGRAISTSSVSGPATQRGWGTNGTCYGLDGYWNGADKSTKVIYFSPNFGGFSFAASYTPDMQEDRRNLASGAGTSWDNNSGQSSESFSIAGNFAHDFNGFNVVAGGGAAFGNWESSNYGDPSFYNAYGQVAFSGFTLGAAWSDGNDMADSTSHTDFWNVAVGGTYNFDAWTVGLGWSHGVYEDGTSATGAGVFEHKLDVYMATGSYALGPGIQIDAEVGYNDYNSDWTQNDDNKGDYNSWEIGMGLKIGF